MCRECRYCRASNSRYGGKVAAISQSRRALYAAKYTRFGKARAILEIAATKQELLLPGKQAGVGHSGL